jgi:AcrR family transcriptional regulator
MPRPARGGRAAPLPPLERRAAIIAATIPLLRAHGLAVTTRQIAEAADVAEGTIFSVFHDKDDLLDAVVEAVFDPASTAARLGEIDPALSLDERVVAAVQLLQEHLADLWQVMVAIGGIRGRAEAGRRGVAVHSKAVARLLEPDRAALRRPPASAAQLLLGLVVANSHPMIAGPKPMPPREIASLLLDGLRRPSPQTPTEPS